MWNENYNEWVQLRNLVVTTHNKDVARMMRAEQISMDTLSIDDSWSLFERHAFENMDPREHPELKEVAKQIAAKCKGLPLALKTGDERIQDLGNQYFDELRSRSLFERVPKSSERYGGKFLMHDLVNDLAQNASSKLCVRLEDCQGSHLLEQSRHLSYSMGEGGNFMKLNLLSKSEQLRTLLPIEIQSLFHPRLSKRVLHNILPSLRSLRALSLSGTATLRCPEIESFPDGGLPFNLQILDIRRCEKLVKGRKEWRLQRLLSLRELYIFHNGSDEEIVDGFVQSFLRFVKSINSWNCREEHELSEINYAIKNADEDFHTQELCNLVFVVVKSVNSWNHKEEHEWSETTHIKNADEDFQTQVLLHHTSVYFAFLEMKHALLHMEHTALMELNIT
ncbi:hypothetical protein FXO37_03406 [Capsicum annuum]|nr:hypothetical protein FXO37_03406 [Capsicum annuum]